VTPIAPPVPGRKKDEGSGSTRARQNAMTSDPTTLSVV
jgi:hypothetical protein